jgi:hypothetical protein
MNRVNPIHIAILLVVILAFSIIKLNAAKEELADNKVAYKETLHLADEISGLKRNYFNKSKVQRDIGRMLRRASLRSAGITKKVTNSSLLLTSTNMNLQALNLLLGKVLNSTYYVSELKIKKLSDKKASLKMEIQW